MARTTYQADIDERLNRHALRKTRVFESLDGIHGRLDGLEVVSFCSNDYLGLSRHPVLIEAAAEALGRYGTGAGAARLVSGTSANIEALESEIAVWKNTDAALVFNSGYQANVGILQALVGAGDYVFADRLNHASLVDGCLLSRATLKRYRHCDMGHLEALLKKVRAGAPATSVFWIVTDSVFSMDGDRVSLPEIVALAEEYGAFVMVDEAHATGLYGEKYSGLCEALGVQERVALQMGTFSKALGSFGAYVAGSQVLIDTLVNRARSWIYSTALPPATIATNRAAVQLVQSDHSIQQRLWQNVAMLEPSFGCSSRTNKSPIMPLVLGSNEKALTACEALLSAGIFVQAIRPPTVPDGSARLRVTVSAAHREGDICLLSENLQKLQGTFNNARGSKTLDSRLRGNDG